MRRFVPAGIVAVIALAVLAVPASASFDPHFSVISKQTSHHSSGDTFGFTDQLFATFNPSDQVGRDQGHCREQAQARKLRCRARIHLNGEVGGFGYIMVNGNVGRHDSRVNVVGGTDDFAGVAGKLLLRGSNQEILHFDLVN